MFQQVRSGLNIYIRRIFDTCWLAKGICRGKCQENEIYNIFCGTHFLCCISQKDMPTLFVK
ncbi:Beta-defensin 30 [Lemmus lemmus]